MANGRRVFATAEVAILTDLREKVGVAALEGCNALHLSRYRRSLAAMNVLMAAAREVSDAIGAREVWIAMCAAEVPAKMPEFGKPLGEA